MNRKALIAVIAALAVILIVGAIFLIVADRPDDNSTADMPAVTNPTEAGSTPADPTAEPDAEQTKPAVGSEEQAIQTTEESGKTELPAETIVPQLPLEPGTQVPSSGELDYEKYNNMTGEEQAAFINTFDSIEDFFAWYNTAKAEYEALHPKIEIGDGVIDAGDLIGGNG